MCHRSPEMDTGQKVGLLQMILDPNLQHKCANKDVMLEGGWIVVSYIA